MNYLKVEKQNWFFGLAILLVAAFVFLRYIPSMKKVSTIKTSIANYEMVVAAAAAKAEKMPQMRRQLKGLRETTANYQEQIPAQRELGDFLQQMAELMNEHKLTSQLIEPSGETSTGKLNCIPIVINCTGSLEQLFGFFESLQKLDRLVRISRIRLDNDKDFGGSVKLQADAVVYYRTDKAGNAGLL